MIPCTSHGNCTFAMSVATSPGCIARMMVSSSFLFSSAAKCRTAMFRAAFEAAYAANPSSISRKFPCDPESLDMKTIVPIGIFVCRSLLAVMMGPMVLVCRWKANSSKELCYHQQSPSWNAPEMHALARIRKARLKGRRTVRWPSDRISAALKFDTHARWNLRLDIVILQRSELRSRS